MGDFCDEVGLVGTEKGGKSRQSERVVVMMVDVGALPNVEKNISSFFLFFSQISPFPFFSFFGVFAAP